MHRVVRPGKCVAVRRVWCVVGIFVRWGEGKDAFSAVWMGREWSSAVFVGV